MEKHTQEAFFMRRCFDLAQLGAGRVSPNPMVGAVIVHQGRIIGEGFHEAFGQAHAEVNAVASVRQEDEALLPYSTLYVSLEPCCIYGKTPPCTNLILDRKIPEVIVSCLDYSPRVHGKGLEILREAGVNVKVGVLEEIGKQLALPSTTYATQERPYIILKWAETQNGYFAPADRSAFWITNASVRRLTHKWRMEADGILVGTTTARQDNPGLDTRFYYGKSPKRIVLDRTGSLPDSLRLFQDGAPTLLFLDKKTNPPTLPNNIQLEYIDFHADQPLDQLLYRLHKLQIGILLVEGGATLIQAFLDQQLWDEARVIRSQSVFLPDGIQAPTLPVARKTQATLIDDVISFYRRP